MKLRISKFVEDNNGGHFEHHVEEQEYPETEGRHNNLCVVCGFPTYPECIKDCPNKQPKESFSNN